MGMSSLLRSGHSYWLLELTSVARAERLVPQSFGCDPRTLGHRVELRPGDSRLDRRVSRNGRKTTVTARDDVFPADHPGDIADALGDQFRMLDVVISRIDYARYQDLAIWQLDVLEHRPFVLVPRIRALVGESARAGLEDNIDDISDR